MQRTRTRGARVLASVLAVVAVFSLAACGDDDDDEASSPTTAAGGATTETTKPFTGDPNSVFCTLARENVTRVAQVGSAVTNQEQLRTLLADVAPAVREIVAVAPSELKDDVTILAEGFEELLETSQQEQFDLAALGAALSDPEFQAAGGELQRYASQVCGITP